MRRRAAAARASRPSSGRRSCVWCRRRSSWSIGSRWRARRTATGMGRSMKATDTGRLCSIDPAGTTIAQDRALMIAREDAEKVYRDLTLYRVVVALEDDGWHVDYELKDPRLKGGGPHYVIDPATGAIVSKRYEQ